MCGSSSLAAKPWGVGCVAVIVPSSPVVAPSPPFTASNSRTISDSVRRDADVVQSKPVRGHRVKHPTVWTHAMALWSGSHIVARRCGSLRLVKVGGPTYTAPTTTSVDKYGSTPEEREAIEKARQDFRNNRQNGFHVCGDLLMRMQMIKESGVDVLSIPPARLGEEEEANYKAVTTAVRKANGDGGWGLYVGGHSTMMGSALSYVGLRLLGEEPNDGDGPIARGQKWIVDHGGATGIPSWGKLYLSTTYMPMSYLYARRYHGSLTDLVLRIRNEIYVKPYDQIDWNSVRMDCCKKIREMAMRKAIKYMRYEAEESRYITIGCIAKYSTLKIINKQMDHGTGFGLGNLLPLWHLVCLIRAGSCWKELRE
nr:dammarenediol II synthase-like [Ipomoea batatas]